MTVTKEMIEAGCKAFLEAFGDPVARPMDYAREVTATLTAALSAQPAVVVPVEPVAYAAFAENGQIRIWSQRPGRIDGYEVKPLYTTPPANLQEENERLKAEVQHLNGQEAFWKHVSMTNAELADHARARATAAEQRVKALEKAANNVISSASDTYRKRNGKIATLEDDSGEKSWIVSYEAFEDLRAALKGGEA